VSAASSTPTPAAAAVDGSADAQDKPAFRPRGTSVFKDISRIRYDDDDDADGDILASDSDG
jgi:hypothetical protein